MARRPSKRKRPPKEKFQIKERVKVESEVFDRKTLLILARIIKKGIIETVDYPVSTGKEANVFRATTHSGGFVAVKIYRITTTSFHKRMEYLEGDPRFEKIKKNKREVTKAFARKEFKNLEICASAGVHAARPIYIEGNVVVMGFLGEKGIPYPTMNIVEPRGKGDLDSILGDIKKMYRAGLVHADISEYNIMLGDAPCLIDFGQGVVTRHPNAEKFLERDVKNILKYFSKYGIKKDLEKVLEWIKK